MKIVAYENASVRCVLEFWQNRCFLHFSVKRWKLSTRRLVRDRLLVLKQLLPELGVSKLETFMPLADPRIMKMAQIFGFREVRRNSEFILMEHKDA